MYLQFNNCSLDIATFTKPIESKLNFYLWLREIANLAGLHEIAKISTRKMVAIPKSQNFVLANNSNNKVTSYWIKAS